MTDVITSRRTNGRATDRVYDGILDLIAKGELAPGERVKILDMVARFHVSNTPVREAISSLVQDNVLDFEPHKGAVVRSYSQEDVRELLEIRAALEGLAARRASESPEHEALSEQLRDHVVLMRDAVERFDYIAYCRHDDLFHELVLEAGTGTQLRRIFDIPRLILRVFVAMADRNRRIAERLREEDTELIGQLRGGIDRHARLTQAIAAGDAASARMLAEEHVNVSIRAISLDEHFPSKRAPVMDD